ncbi:MAG: hypothetical protein PUP93_18740 [Rhizonema sp. NSF051]|nr:hypothetical protein [Rhizonema sp. NSF051]
MIYVSLLWALRDGYWTTDTQETRDRIDDSDNWYYMDEETYKQNIAKP